MQKKIIWIHENRLTLIYLLPRIEDVLGCDYNKDLGLKSLKIFIRISICPKIIPCNGIHANSYAII